MADEGRPGLLPIPCCSGQSESARCLPASPMQVVAESSESSQSAWREALATAVCAAGALDSVPASSAPLSSSALCRQASEVGAVCVNALVRICAGGDQRWSSLLRHLSRRTRLGGVVSANARLAGG